MIGCDWQWSELFYQAFKNVLLWSSWAKRKAIGLEPLVKLGWALRSWLPNQMISLIFMFGFLCQSSSCRLWTHIGWGRLFWPLLRPQMIVFDHFFAKYVFYGYDEGRLFFGGHVGHFFGPGNGFPKMRGDFMLWRIFLMWCYETCLQSNIKTKNK